MEHPQNVPVNIIKQFIELQNNITQHKAQLKDMQQRSAEMSGQIIQYMNNSKLEQILTSQKVIEVKETIKQPGVNKHVLEAAAQELGIPPERLIEVIKKHQKNMAASTPTKSLTFKNKK
jgi:TolA-binding protein